jgi:hypothetical protein
MLKQHNQIMRRIQRKILDPHPQIVHHEPGLVGATARQPRCDEPARGPKLLERLDE